MPLFRDHGLLFVHIPKNAGRSIEEALLGAAGSSDGGRRSPLNRAATALARQTGSSFAQKYLIGTLDVALASQHLTYAEMELLGFLPEAQALRSFAIVRNPYDRALSSAIHFARGSWVDESDPELRQAEFAQVLDDWLVRPLSDHNERAHRRPQLDFVRDLSGRIVVDDILRFENLAEDFGRLIATIDGPAISLTKRGDSGRKRCYADYYGHTAKALVKDAFGADLEAFGYEF